MKHTPKLTHKEHRLLLFGVFDSVGDFADSARKKSKEWADKTGEAAQDFSESYLEEADKLRKGAMEKAHEGLETLQKETPVVIDKATKMAEDALKTAEDFKEGTVEWATAMAEEAVEGSRKALDYLREKPDQLRRVIERLVEDNKYKLARKLIDTFADEETKAQLKKAELAELAISGNVISQFTLLEQEMEAGNISRFWYNVRAGFIAAKQTALMQTKPAAMVLVEKDREIIRKKYDEQLTAIVRKYPYLTKEMLREIVRAGLED